MPVISRRQFIKQFLYLLLFFLQELEGAVGIAQAQVDELRAAAAAKVSTINDLQASSTGAKGIVIVVHILYIMLAFIVTIADGLTKIAARLG